MADELVTPTWTAAEALEILAEQAVVVAHHLLQHARPDSMDETVARTLLDTLNLEVRSALGDGLIDFCQRCGTSGSLAVMMSSRVHLACRQGTPR